MILIGPTGPAKITLPQSLTSQHLTKWRRLPKPQKRLNSEYPRSIHPRSALQFAFYILVYNSQASAFLFSADPLSGSHHQLFAFLPPCSVSLCSQAARNRTCQKRPERSFQSIRSAPICWCPTSRLLRAAALMSQVALTRSGFFFISSASAQQGLLLLSIEMCSMCSNTCL